MVPMGGRLIFERVTCETEGATLPNERAVRLFVNDAMVDLIGEEAAEGAFVRLAVGGGIARVGLQDAQHPQPRHAPLHRFRQDCQRIRRANTHLKLRMSAARKLLARMPAQRLPICMRKRIHDKRV